MSERVFSKEWSDWILENISRGCDLDDIYSILFKQGFNENDIEKALNYSPGKQKKIHLNEESPKEKRIQSNVIKFQESFKSIPKYTQKGFIKTTINKSVFKKITDFYHAHQNSAKTEVVAGDFVTNIDKKSTPSKTIDLPDQLKDEIHASLLKDLEQWSSTKLLPTYVYGIRIYQNGAILSSHKDRRETHIIGTIINIDQDLINEWPLEIEDHDGEVHKIYLEPGEVIFYESATLIHGRPDPLEGKFFSNVFCHYMPEIS
jgi:phage anti-repressor protein